jgi:hypothetical protein
MTRGGNAAMWRCGDGAVMGAGKADRARELVSYCARHTCLADLLAHGRQVRPDISW